VRIDLFEFVEGVIRGVVYFFYNVVETLWQILRYPRRGPIRLYRAHMKKGRQQIGGLTFLFLVFFTGFGLMVRRPPPSPMDIGGDNGLPTTVQLLEVFSKPPRFDTDIAWMAIVASIVTTVIIDAAIRAFLRWRWPARPQRRALLLSAIEYVLVLPLLAVSALLIALLLGLGSTHVPDALGVSLLAFCALTALAACAPAAWLLLRPRRGRNRASLWRRWSAEGAVSAAFGALLLGATLVGQSTMERVRAAGGGDGMRHFELVGFTCMLGGDSPHVDFALTNANSYDVLMFPEQELEAMLYSNRDGPTGFALTRDDPAAGPILFKSKESKLLRMRLSKADVSGTSKPWQCLVREKTSHPYMRVNWQDWMPALWNYELEQRRAEAKVRAR
jgi:hypothetical protein